VPNYLIELYVPQGRELREATTRVRHAADGLRREGVDVRYLRSIFIPADETCFYVLEASSSDTVQEASRRASLHSQRIVEAQIEPVWTEQSDG
jgi:Nickel responsive protein SCO4226-like